MIKKPITLPVNLKQMALVAGIVVVLVFLFGYTNRLIRSSELRRQVTLWEQEVKLEQQRVEANRARLAYTRSNKYVIDKAHTELGMAFPNEIPVKVVGEEPDLPLSNNDKAAATTPNWELWQQRFLDH